MSGVLPVGTPKSKDRDRIDGTEYAQTSSGAEGRPACGSKKGANGAKTAAIIVIS
jgi:hypothetical protein